MKSQETLKGDDINSCNEDEDRDNGDGDESLDDNDTDDDWQEDRDDCDEDEGLDDDDNDDDDDDDWQADKENRNNSQKKKGNRTKWKTQKKKTSKTSSQQAAGSDPTDHSPSSGDVNIPPELASLSDEALYQSLKDLGEDPGPVLPSTRQTYLQRLASLRSGRCQLALSTSQPGLC